MILSTIVTFDWWFEKMLLSIRSPWGVRLFEGITFFGNPRTITVFALFLLFFLFFSRRFRPYFSGSIIAFSGAAVSGFILKELVARARPDSLIPALTQSGFSFPSGHATAAMVLYGFGAFILCREYPERTTPVILLTAFGIVLIGFSRLYLGVHFPSDVIAGYALGGLWLLIGMRVVPYHSCT
ncbi:MAG TPA: phosphatase PAP2 family protein [Candidatus Paceibacterota bacterium]|nr:phosphatase PAP2 family protein [Candidatus Paceibacterota bacterium]